MTENEPEKLRLREQVLLATDDDTDRLIETKSPVELSILWLSSQMKYQEMQEAKSVSLFFNENTYKGIRTPKSGIIEDCEFMDNINVMVQLSVIPNSLNFFLINPNSLYPESGC